MNARLRPLCCFGPAAAHKGLHAPPWGPVENPGNRPGNRPRLPLLRQAMEEGMSKEELFELTYIDPWWLAQMEELHQIER